MARGKVRVISTIEKAFTAFTERNIDYVSFSQLKDWINYNTKDGISSPSWRLSSKSSLSSLWLRNFVELALTPPKPFGLTASQKMSRLT